MLLGQNLCPEMERALDELSFGALMASFPAAGAVFAVIKS